MLDLSMLYSWMFFALLGGAVGFAVDRITTAPGTDTRTCTCHLDDNPPKPCQRKFALGECRAAAHGVTGTHESKEN